MHPRRIAILALALLIAALVQTTQGHRFATSVAKPDLVLLLVVTHSVVRGVEEGLLGGILGGLLVDLLSAVPFGAATLGMGLIGLATGLRQELIHLVIVIQGAVGFAL